ncbi:MAG: monovalent cation/H+ antiporter subunit D [Proteobacteria bacterium]|nr:monovalent cation/H+ antiporter subunit D [Pseudomonadota bacterium]
MSHWIIAPVILPALMGAFVLLLLRHDLLLQRVFGLASSLGLVALTLVLWSGTSGGAIESYELGSWPAPFGIVLVADRLSALMVLLTAVLGLMVLAYVAATGWDARGRHFHALYQFQLMGLMGAMLTGDIFNLFVFFEILLIASYGLMIHGGGRMRLRVGVQYVVINLAGSTLFLFALGAIYGLLGTLNMADMALRVDQLPEGDMALLRVTAALLVMVFLLKGGLVPLHFWLPNTYALASAPVAALFAVMTKVGAYSVIRIYTLVFPPDAAGTGTMVADVLMPFALVTLAIGALGVLAGGTLARVVAFAALGSMGTLFAAVAAFGPDGIAAALYYLVHSTLAGAALFLVVDQVRARRGSSALVPLAPMAGGGIVAAAFFASAIAMAGMPPLSGFLGKLMVLDALRDDARWVSVWSVVLVGSLVTVVGFARAGSILFWKAHDASVPAPGGSAPADAAPPEATSAWGLAALSLPLAAIVALTILAGPAHDAMRATALQLADRDGYIRAVLGTPGATALAAATLEE